MISKCALVFSLLFTASTLLEGGGLGVYPIEHHITPRKTATFRVSNKANHAIAVQVKTESWTLTEEGKEVNEPTDKLVLYPYQFILKGNTSKLVKVGCKSRDAVDLEGTYRVIFKELPVSLSTPGEKTGASLYMATTFRTAFYVIPKKQTSIVRVVEGKLDNDGSLRILFQNEGSVHTHLRAQKLSLRMANGETKEISDSSLLGPISGRNLHANLKRNFTLNLDPFLSDEKPVEAVLTLETKFNGEIEEHVFAL
jgi:P pilus assembly chaperone PapD